MYKSNMQETLIQALRGIQWQRSSVNEDDFRQVLVSSIGKMLPSGSYSIPATAHGNGDVLILGRRVEIKYANIANTTKLSSFLEDFESLFYDAFADRCEFSILGMNISWQPDCEHVHHTLDLPQHPKIIKPSMANFMEVVSKKPMKGKYLKYCSPMLILPISEPIKKTAIPSKHQKSGTTSSYLKFKPAPQIEREAILEIGDCIAHVTVIGSFEDGFIALLYTALDNVSVTKSGKQPVDIPLVGGGTVHVATRSIGNLSTAGSQPCLLQAKIPVYTA